jgi:hypothetical protein
MQLGGDNNRRLRTRCSHISSRILERLKQLFAPVKPNPNYSAISLGSYSPPCHASLFWTHWRGTGELSSYPSPPDNLQ